MKCSALAENEILATFQEVLQHLTFYDELSISNASIQTAFDFCHDINEKDTPFIALTIKLDGVLWSGDKTLINGLQTKGFNRFYIV